MIRHSVVTLADLFAKKCSMRLGMAASVPTRTFAAAASPSFRRSFKKRNVPKEDDVDSNVLSLPDGRAGFRPMSETFINLELSTFTDDEHDDWDEEDEEDDDLKVDPVYSYDENEKISALTREVREFEMEKEKEAKKWVDKSIPLPRFQELDEFGRAYGRGSRKTSQARVWVFPGEGNITVNKKELIDYFGRDHNRRLIIAPFVVTRTCGMFDVVCQVTGGGLSGQAGAIRHGIARALEKYNPDYFRRPLKSFGYLTRDPRMVESKKYGLRKARKAKQWVKR